MFQQILNYGFLHLLNYWKLIHAYGNRLQHCSIIKWRQIIVLSISRKNNYLF